MQKIITVGNLRILGEYEPAPSHSEGKTLHLIAVNGGDIVAEEFFYGGTVRQAVNRLLQIRFDIYTSRDIAAGLVNIEITHQGRLISGKIAGFSAIEYFKRIDDTDYYKHYTHCPKM